MATDPDAALHSAVPGKYKPGGAAPLPNAGTVFDVIERGPDTRPVAPTSDTFAPPPSLGDVFGAAKKLSIDDAPDPESRMIEDGYAPIVDALGLGRSENPGWFGDRPPVLSARVLNARTSGIARSQGRSWLDSQLYRDEQEQLVVDQIKAHRAKDPNFLPGLPDTVEGLHDYFREQAKQKNAAAGEVLSRSSGVLGTAASLAGGVVGTSRDPFNIVTLPIGGGGKTLIQIAAREALVNGTLEAIETPSIAHSREELGQHLTAGEAVRNVISAATFGAVVSGTIHLGAVHVPPLLFKAMPASVQARWAAKMKIGDVKLADVLGDMDNRELAGFARSTIGERMTPDEKAAANSLEREQELGEASPFVAGPQGDAAHNRSLGDALQGIIDGVQREAPARGDLLASTAPIALRSPVPAADVHFDAQWAAIKGNEHGIGSHGEFLTSKKGAVGPAQVMPGTAPYAAKLAGVPFDEHRYRTDAGYNELLGRAYYSEQLQTFGDPAMAAAAYNAGPGTAAKGTGLRGALRKAAEHGEPGNWEAYLPRETQRYVADFRRRTGTPENSAAGAVAEAAGLNEDEIAAAQRSADAAEAEGLAASRDGQGLDNDLAGDRAAIADVPVLKRELFTSDEDWADAQAAFHQSLNAPEEPSARAAPSEGAVPGPQGVGSAERAPGAAAGPFGPEFPDAAGDWRATLAALREAKDGVVPGALDHPEIGPIDLPFGEAGTGKSDGYGLAKLEAHHPEVIAELPELLRGMAIVSRSDNRIRLESANHEAAVRLDFDGEKRSWLLTAYGKPREVEKAPPLPVDRRVSAPLATDDGRAAKSGQDGSPDRGAVSDISASGPIDNDALKAFDDPAGAGARDQVASIEHDLRMAAADPATAKRKYAPFGDDRQLTLTELFAELDGERDAVAALRACAGEA